jgi:integrase
MVKVQLYWRYGGTHAWARWTPDDGSPRRRVPLGKLSEAEAEIELDKLSQQLNPTRTNPLFGTLVATYLQWHKTNVPDSHFRTKQICEQYLVPRFGGLRVSDMKPMLVEALKNDRMEVAAPSTVDKELRTLNAVVNFGVKWDMVEKNPFKVVQSPPDSEDDFYPYYTVEQLEKLYAQQSTWTDVWTVMVCTGIRRKEAHNIEWSWFVGNKLMIPSKNGNGNRTKSKKRRVIPCHPSVLEALERIKETGAGTPIPRVNARSISRAFDRDARRAEVGGSLHWLRHTYASHHAMRGTPMRTLQQLLGHASVVTTERYAHLSPDYLDGFDIDLSSPRTDAS